MHDLIDEIELVGNHQTITTQGAITVTVSIYGFCGVEMRSLVYCCEGENFECALSEVMYSVSKIV